MHKKKFLVIAIKAFLLLLVQLYREWWAAHKYINMLYKDMLLLLNRIDRCL